MQGRILGLFLLILWVQILILKTMFQRILRESLIEVIEHPTLVRIAFLTGFVHTLVSFFAVARTVYVLLEKNTDISSIEGTLFEYMKALFELAKSGLNAGIIITIIVIGLVGYLVYPIGHGMMVSYVQHHSTSKALKKSLNRYFTIIVAEGILAVVTFGSRHLTALRYLYSMGIIGNIMILIVLILIGGFLMVCTFLYAYTNIGAVSDEFSSKRPVEQAQEAIKNSSKIAAAHPWITIKFLLLSILLELRFFLMTTIVIAIPAFLVWIALQLGLIGGEQAPVIVLIAIGILLVISIYINSIIDAFFTAYRYKLYSELKEKPEE